MDKSSLTRRFENEEERLMFSRLLDLYVSAQKNQKCTFSSFLNPEILARCSAVFESELPPYIDMLSFGGADNCERKMIGFIPVAFSGEVIFPIIYLEISYNNKFSKKLSHRDFLGSILALGIERRAVGDINVSESSAAVFVQSGIAEFIASSLTKAGNTAVNVKAFPLSRLSETQARAQTEAAEPSRLTAASLRLDAVIAACLRMPRSEASALISSERVFVNWRAADKPSMVLSEGETVTVRGFGRIVFKEILGKSKKDRFIISVVITV